MQTSHTQIIPSQERNSSQILFKIRNKSCANICLPSGQEIFILTINPMANPLNLIVKYLTPILNPIFTTIESSTSWQTRWL